MKKESIGRFAAVAAAAGAAVLAGAGDALAINAPTSGSFAYDIYDIAVNSILKGPIGFTCGVASMAFGAVNAIRGAVMAAVPAILGGAALLKADAIVQTLGMIF